MGYYKIEAMTTISIFGFDQRDDKQSFFCIDWLRRHIKTKLNLEPWIIPLEGKIDENFVNIIKQHAKTSNAIIFLVGDEESSNFFYSLGLKDGILFGKAKPVLFIYTGNSNKILSDCSHFMLNFDDLKNDAFNNSILFFLINDIENFWINYANAIIDKFNRITTINLERLEDIAIVEALKDYCPNDYPTHKLDILVAKKSTSNFDDFPYLHYLILKKQNPNVILTTKERIIKIFLASSSELQADRDEFVHYFLQQNNRQQGYQLEIVRWENFLDAMSETRLQNEYNQAICDCDIFVSLFFTKTGKFTEEEFDVAHRQFKDTKKPRIYTFFKNADVNINRIIREDFLSLDSFKNRLGELGHFHTGYNNIQDLKLQFKDQLEKLLDDGL